LARGRQVHLRGPGRRPAWLWRCVGPTNPLRIPIFCVPEPQSVVAQYCRQEAVWHRVTALLAADDTAGSLRANSPRRGRRRSRTVDLTGSFAKLGVHSPSTWALPHCAFLCSVLGCAPCCFVVLLPAGAPQPITVTRGSSVDSSASSVGSRDVDSSLDAGAGPMVMASTCASSQHAVGADKEEATASGPSLLHKKYPHMMMVKRGSSKVTRSKRKLTPAASSADKPGE
jgi:hypothetical protein